MDKKGRTEITVRATVKVPVDTVWELWTSPDHITQWYYALDTWHTPKAKNDVRAGGEFDFRMEAKDNSAGFDFRGIYDDVIKNRLIISTLGDGRRLEITFDGSGSKTTVTETFETENENSAEMQRAGWQAILDNFRKYAEEFYGIS